jgi:hypothetical protein
MQKKELINRIRSLFNIDGHLLPELTGAQQLQFLRDPVRYFLESDEAQSDAIMREIEGRQPRLIANPDKSSVAPSRKAPRVNKAKTKIEAQREFLLPIPGGKNLDRRTASGPNAEASERDDRKNVSVRRSR